MREMKHYVLCLIYIMWPIYVGRMVRHDHSENRAKSNLLFEQIWVYFPKEITNRMIHFSLVARKLGSEQQERISSQPQTGEAARDQPATPERGEEREISVYIWKMKVRRKKKQSLRGQPAVLLCDAVYQGEHCRVLALSLESTSTAIVLVRLLCPLLPWCGHADPLYELSQTAVCLEGKTMGKWKAGPGPV